MNGNRSKLDELTGSPINHHFNLWYAENVMPGQQAELESQRKRWFYNNAETRRAKISAAEVALAKVKEHNRLVPGNRRAEADSHIAKAEADFADLQARCERGAAADQVELDRREATRLAEEQATTTPIVAAFIAALTSQVSALDPLDTSAEAELLRLALDAALYPEVEA